MTALSVNVNKFALVRNARGADLPNLIDISNKCLNYGADGITVHPRPDERHAKFSDLEPLKNLLSKFENKEFDVCTIFYNQFKNVITQIPQEQQIIPLKMTEDETNKSEESYEFEPDEDEILGNLLRKIQT